MERLHLLGATGAENRQNDKAQQEQARLIREALDQRNSREWLDGLGIKAEPSLCDVYDAIHPAKVCEMTTPDGFVDYKAQAQADEGIKAYPPYITPRPRASGFHWLGVIVVSVALWYLVCLGVHVVLEWLQ